MEDLRKNNRLNMKPVKVGKWVFMSMQKADLKFGKHEGYIGSRIRKYNSKMPCGMEIKKLTREEYYRLRN